MKKVAVIGAGISGLICAYEMQKARLDVTVYEKEKTVGGRMCARVKDGLAFDFGANFFVKHYKQTEQYCKELGVLFKPRTEGRAYTFRNNKWHHLPMKSNFSLLKFSALSLLSRIRLFLFFVKARFKKDHLDFFDLSSAADFDTGNAYDYSKKHLGKEVTDIIFDGYCSTYQFHRLKEISLGALLPLLRLFAAGPRGFQLHHSHTMSSLPNALAKKLTVKTNTPISHVHSTKKGVVVKVKNKNILYDAVVIASTANFTKKIYKNPSKQQKHLLNDVKYAISINVSFKVPEKALRDLTILTVAYSENNKIADACHEVFKGYVKDGKTLVNIALHEDFAKKIIHKSDKQIFEITKKAFVDICPFLDDVSVLEDNDLHRWPQVMPKFYPGYLTAVKNFLENGQGDNNVFFCGDYLNSPWVEGSIGCGKRVAIAVCESIQ